MVSADLARMAIDLPPEERLELDRRLIESVVAPETLTDAPRATGPGVDTMPRRQHRQAMETLILKMDRRHVQLLKDQAKARGCSQAAVVRELIKRHLGSGSRLSLHERSRDLCGSLKGPPDLSTRRLSGYGRD